MSRKIEPPYLEISFYFSDTSESDSFQEIFSVLRKMGTNYLTEEGVLVYQAEYARAENFPSVHHAPSQEIVRMELDELISAMMDEKTKVLQVGLVDAVGTVEGGIELLTYSPISSEAAMRGDHHPISLLTTGGLFALPLEERKPLGQIKKASRKVYQRFCDLVRALSPSYGAITIEYPLECPEDLRIDSRSLAFRDFFMSDSFLGSSSMRKIEDLFKGAHQEKIGDGLYISSSKFMNPKGRSLPPIYSQKASTRVAELIASRRK